MDRLEKKKADRLRFINAVYEQTDGDRSRNVDMWQLGRDLAFDPPEISRIADYLAGERLIEFRADQGVIALTHRGVVEVEAALSKPDEPTNYFPAVINVLSVGSMVGSQIQQAGERATLRVASPAELREVINLLREKLPALPISDDARREAEAEVDTLESQMNSPRPKPTIIQQSLQTLRSICENAAGDMIAGEIVNRLSLML